MILIIYCKGQSRKAFKQQTLTKAKCHRLFSLVSDEKPHSCQYPHILAVVLLALFLGTLSSQSGGWKEQGQGAVRWVLRRAAFLHDRALSMAYASIPKRIVTHVKTCQYIGRRLVRLRMFVGWCFSCCCDLNPSLCSSSSALGRCLSRRSNSVLTREGLGQRQGLFRFQNEV